LFERILIFLNLLVQGKGKQEAKVGISPLGGRRIGREQHSINEYFDGIEIIQTMDEILLQILNSLKTKH
jgi:hypothetical protein